MKCEVCDNEIVNRGAGRFCSRACYGKASSATHQRSRDARPPRICVVCSVEFVPPAKSLRETCSKVCRYTMVSQTHKANGIKPLITPSAEDQRKRIKGPSAPWWKGGSTVNEKGYRIAIAPDDFPFRDMLDSKNRIREHRMIYALHIGRSLRRSEVVHHVNGDRLDNRIENLELFSSHSAHMKHHH